MQVLFLLFAVADVGKVYAVAYADRNCDHILVFEDDHATFGEYEIIFHFVFLL